MTIKTRFKINDRVFFMYDNKIYEGSVRYIRVNVKSDLTIRIVYDIYFSRGTTNCYEESLFTTKEELIKSL